MKIFVALIFTAAVSFADCDVPDVMQQIRPGASWTMTNNDPTTLVWQSTQTIPTKADVQAGIAACQQNEISTRQQMQADIVNVRTSTNTVQVRMQSLIDLLQLRGQL